MRGLVAALVVVAGMWGCGSDASSTPGGDGADAPPEGFVRLRPPPVMLQPGESKLLAQWVSVPSDRDLDVVDVAGWQGPGGHHALVYSTARQEEPGFTREWRDSDQLFTRFVGGVGGEAGAAVKLPEGVVFRIATGSSLLVQTHYINATDAPIMGESYVDLKLVDPVPSARVASLFASTTPLVAIEPGTSASATVDCVLEQPLELLMMSNHMHEYGVSTRTVVIDGGQETVLKDDPIWSPEWAFDPNFSTFTAEAPMVLPAGALLRTECHWDNTSGAKVSFPDEMCVFFGIVIAPTDMNCTDGTWS